MAIPWSTGKVRSASCRERRRLLETLRSLICPAANEAIASLGREPLAPDDPRQEPRDVLRVVERSVVRALEGQPAET